MSEQTYDARETFSLGEIRTDGGTQARAGLNEEKVVEYQQMLEEAKANINAAWPFKDAVELFYDGSNYWLADGFHRVEACKRATWLWRIKANIHQGTRRDAVLFACGANATHGLPRSGDDKRRAVETLLRDQEWGAWSDREIARRCRVSHPFVAKVRSEIDTGNVSSINERVYVHPKTGKETVMNTAAIGGDNTDYSAAYAWLAAYTDQHGRTWRDLEDNQIHHANSPCYQAFVKEFPNLTDPKLYLKRAVYRLRQENPPKQEVAQYEFTTAVRGFVERHGGERENWRSYALAVRRRRNHVIFDQLRKWLRQYNYIDPMIDEALDTIIKEEEARKAETAESTYTFTAELEQFVQQAETAVSAYVGNGEQAADEVQSAVELLNRMQRDIERLVIKTRNTQIAALCAKAANTISYLVADLKTVGD